MFENQLYSFLSKLILKFFIHQILIIIPVNMLFCGSNSIKLYFHSGEIIIKVINFCIRNSQVLLLVCQFFKLLNGTYEDVFEL